MAIYNAGYLSPFKNKLGNAVGRKWRTLDVIAVYNGTPRNPNTEAQQRVRVRMANISKIAAKASELIKLGFAASCDGTKVPPRAKFVKVNWEAVQATSPSAVNVTWTDIKVSEGGLPVPDLGAPDFTEPLEVTCTINDDTDTPGADSHDIIYLFALEPTSYACMAGEPVTRSDDKATLTFTQWWNGRSVHVYAFAIGGGRDNMGVTSDTAYLGTGTIS